MTEAQRRNLREESIGDLLKDLVFQIGVLFRQEITLARAEVSRATNKAVASMMTLAVGAALGLAALVILLQAAVYGVALAGLPMWLSSLVIGGAAIIIALVLVMSGKRALSLSSMAPTRTADSIKKDARLVEEQVR